MSNQRIPNLGMLFTTTQPDFPGGRNVTVGSNGFLYTTDNGPASSFVIAASMVGANYFGDGSQGIGSFTSPASVTVPTADKSVVVSNYTSLTIGATGSLTLNTRAQAWLVYVQGNCVINGTLSMTARGASAISPSSYNITRYFTDISLDSEEANQLGIAETL